MDDHDVIGRIDQLVAQEHTLRERAAGDGLSEADQTKLRSLEVALDQCWDLLRQRRARREFGEDPAGAQVRPVSEVEGYRQ